MSAVRPAPPAGYRVHDREVDIALRANFWKEGRDGVRPPYNQSPTRDLRLLGDSTARVSLITVT